MSRLAPEPCTGLLLDEAALYFLARDSIRRLSAESPDPVSLATARRTDIYGLAVDDFHIYWADAERGAIMRTLK